MKYNVDRCSKGNPSVTGARGIIRDWKGDMFLGFAKMLGIKSYNYAKAIAMWFGIKTRHDLEEDNVKLEGDSKIIIDLLLKKFNFPWRISSIITDHRR